MRGRIDYSPAPPEGVTTAWGLRADWGGILLNDAVYFDRDFAAERARSNHRLLGLSGPFSLVEMRWVPPETKWEPVEDPAQFGFRAKGGGDAVVSWEKGDEVEVVVRVVTPGRWEEVKP